MPADLSPVHAAKTPTGLSWRNWIFKRIHGNKIVYNSCWEDPRCDRALLQLDANSELVMITSAGCNALDYLLDEPTRIHCVDVNLRQNALMELKQSALQELSQEEFFLLFGQGVNPDIDQLYHQQLRHNLSNSAATFWDEHLKYFRPGGKRSGFYYRGSSGAVAWMIVNLLRRKKRLSRAIEQLWNSPSIHAQRVHYYALEERLLKAVLGGSLRQHLLLSFAGVPAAQRQLIREESGGLRNYLRDQMRHIFADLPLRDNYFYRVYWDGQYRADCCPEYLKSNNFQLLRRLNNRVSTYTSTLAQFLRDRPKAYSHFVLLDHQDWLAANAPQALAEEWDLILRNSRPGTRILLRSAASTPLTIPSFVRDRCRFLEQEAQEQAKLDRVGTYAGVFLLEVK